MQDDVKKRKMVLTAAIRTIASACRHLYEDKIEAAKKAGDVIEVVRLKAKMQKDWEAWTTLLVGALEACDKPSLIITPAEAEG